MKKILITFALLVATISASAFKFDGINLNLPYVKVAQEITKRGYAYDSDRNCLRGNCQGTEIYLHMNYVDVKEAGALGQLIVEVPMQKMAESMDGVYTLLNVIYHQVGKTENAVTYSVDDDGTTLTVTRRGDSVLLTYNTPNYKPKK